MALNVFKADNNEVIRGVDGKWIDETVINSFKSIKSKNNKSKNLMYIEAIKKPMFLSPNAKKVFNYLK